MKYIVVQREKKLVASSFLAPMPDIRLEFNTQSEADENLLICKNLVSVGLNEWRESEEGSIECWIEIEE